MGQQRDGPKIPHRATTQLWASNGTVAGTIFLHDFGNLAAANSGSIGNLNIIGRVSNGIVLLEALNAVKDFGVLGTNELDIDASTTLGTGVNVAGLLQIDNSITGDVQLWVSLGTVGSTLMLHDFGGNPKRYSVVGE